MTEKKVKPCPYRVYSERRASATIAGEYVYQEHFMPCYREKCACYYDNGEEILCLKNGGNLCLYKRSAEG